MKLSNAQRGILNLLSLGYSVTAEPLAAEGEWRAICEHYPHPKISTLKALHAMGLVDFVIMLGIRHYSLTPRGMSVSAKLEGV